MTPGPDLAYLTGYAPTAITERLTLLVVAPDRPPTMVVPKLERPDAEKAVGAPAVTLVDWLDGEDPYRAAARRCWPATAGTPSPTGPGRCTCSACSARCPTRPTSASPRACPCCGRSRTPHELERLAAAGAGADATYEEILVVPFAGRTENEVAADLAALLRKHGHSQVDFTVVGSGPNGANPHHEAGERTIEPGDAVVLDFGGLCDGYGSDTTRTVCVGEPTEEIRTVHDIVRRAQQAAFEAVRPGRDVPGDRPGGPPGHHRGRVRRVLHPPGRPRHRADHARAAVHGGG